MLAISPDTPLDLYRTRQKYGLNFPLLSDTELALAQSLGIAFRDPGGQPLPVPAVFITGTDGTVHFGHVDPDYSQRLDSAVIIAAARALRRRLLPPKEVER